MLRAYFLFVTAAAAVARCALIYARCSSAAATASNASGAAAVSIVTNSKLDAQPLSSIFFSFGLVDVVCWVHVL